MINNFVVKAYLKRSLFKHSLVLSQWSTLELNIGTIALDIYCVSKFTGIQVQRAFQFQL